MKNIHRLKVAFGDTDAAGIVFYPNFYRWMDQAAHELIGAAVLPVSKLQTERQIILPLLETFCQFKSPLFFEDLVEVHSEVVEMKEKVMKIEHVFKRGDHIVASGYEVRAWTSTESGTPKAVPVPDDVRSALGHGPDGQ
ncbi:4-hydroxybenzoyl-CoA thioesterase [Domibacillus antri]|uniref:4-hydroxybenzoyl-CoA thioesterase n=1 Tax=Domibacillus antri TaxID=1714264 RepID=A0A1Q8Q1P7_9BACI|nr:thioesterase family protein [Domibacillus antri]OLN21235.1 4-hydroxybenzoyl-CoA thioesterase [Domibacillus antri]